MYQEGLAYSSGTTVWATTGQSVSSPLLHFRQLLKGTLSVLERPENMKYVCC